MIQCAHILNIMQAVVCRNDVVKCACFTTGSHCVATGQLLNAWVGRIVRIRKRKPFTVSHGIGLPGQYDDVVPLRLSCTTDDHITFCCNRLHQV